MRRFRVLTAAGGAVVALASLCAPAGASLLPGTGSVDALRRPAYRIHHIVVLMQENRSFDSYFGRLHYLGQPAATPEPPDASNPDPTSPDQAVAAYHKTRYCEVADLKHTWNQMHRDWDGGAMDGFTAENVDPADPKGRRAMGYYTRQDLPYYYALYRKFAIDDHYFASVMGPTFPNRLYLLAATSFGHINNDFPPPSGFKHKTIFQELDRAGVSWKVYYSQFAFASKFAYIRQHGGGRVVPITNYYLDAANGRLPQVSFIDPIFDHPSANIENDEHPPSNVQVGERYVHHVLGSLFRSPDWPSSALFLTYDEGGGFYDHVSPPKAPIPDGIKPMWDSNDIRAGFGRYGFRVPVAVVSPYSRPHFVSHVVHDHTAILRFIEVRFGLHAMTNRDAHQKPMLEFFDFSHRSFATPPKLPRAPLNQTQVEVCRSVGPG